MSMNTPSAETAAADIGAPVGSAPEPAAPPAPGRADRQPVPGAKRARKAAAAKPAAAKSAKVPASAPSRAAAEVSGAAVRQAARKNVVAAKSAAPAVRMPVRKVMAAAAPGGAAEVTHTATAKAAKAAKRETSRKREKLVRDSFTMPKSECVLLADLKQRAAALAHPAKKSELLRAGVKALSVMGDTAFLAALYDVPTLKTGRPAAQDGPSHKAKVDKAGVRRGS